MIEIVRYQENASAYSVRTIQTSFVLVGNPWYQVTKLESPKAGQVTKKPSVYAGQECREHAEHCFKECDHNPENESQNVVEN